MRSVVLLLALGSVFFLSLGIAHANSVQVGGLAFNPNVPGVLNDFEIDNFTGTNNLGGLLSPVADNLIFQSATLTLSCANAACVTDLGGNSQTLLLSDLGPGFYTNTVFSAADEFLQAVFTASFGATALNLVDGTTFTGSSSISATLVASNGSFLQPNVDSLVLSDSNPSIPTPEPPTWVLLSAGLIAISSFRRLKGDSTKGDANLTETIGRSELECEFGPRILD
jgi:hypothetical protein